MEDLDSHLPRPGTAPQDNPKLVLLVDDDDSARAWIRAALQHQGYCVVEATDGGNVAAQIEQLRPDHVIIDLSMPVKDGIEVLIELRERRLQTHLVAMSGISGATSSLAAARLLGAHDTLCKPFGLESLLKILSRNHSDGRPRVDTLPAVA